jgi:type III secretion protein J
VKWLMAMLLGCTVLLSGCGQQTDLFSGLSEQDANDVIAALAEQSIEAHKRTEKTGAVVAVEGGQINRAVRVLDAAGLPRRARTSLGEIFKKEGVISTPLEERARYIYALSQELEATLSQIDGVVVARVHVVLPERVAPGEPVQPASAAVFIKHNASLDPDSVRGRIQQMVASSIPGMVSGGATPDSRKFSIVFVPAAEFHDSQQWVSFGPFRIDSEQIGFWKRMVWLAPVGLVLLLGIVALLLRADWRSAVLGRVMPRRGGGTNLPSRV